MSNSTITYSLSRTLPPAAVQRLLHQTDWGHARTLPHITQMLAGSLCVGAWQGDQLVGFARAVTDDVYRAFVEDVIVDEALRGQGIGGELMRLFMARLEHIELITLVCAPERMPFYTRLGFKQSHMNLMERYHKLE